MINGKKCEPSKGVNIEAAKDGTGAWLVANGNLLIS